jgi:hypothetical protein
VARVRRLGVAEVADRFSRETLIPILEQAGFPLPQVWTWPVYNTLSPATEEVRASRLRIIAAQNAERRRLERDLHDGAQQSLIALKIKLGLAAGLSERDPRKASELLRELEADAQRTLESLRELARGLYPALLADQGLVAAVEAQIRKAATPMELEAHSVGRYPPEVEAAVYFCCLEAQNVSKHANDAHATVFLTDDGDLTFEVSDEGPGFDPRSTGYGTGLQGMADRLDAIGGLLEVRSAPGEGTTITGRVPGGARGDHGRGDPDATLARSLEALTWKQACKSLGEDTWPDTPGDRRPRDLICWYRASSALNALRRRREADQLEDVVPQMVVWAERVRSDAAGGPHQDLRTCLAVGS